MSRSLFALFNFLFADRNPFIGVLGRRFKCVQHTAVRVHAHSLVVSVYTKVYKTRPEYMLRFFLLLLLLISWVRI